MTRNANSCRVTIFEGPDGAGKSTIAEEYAKRTGARYFHHGPYKRLGWPGLSRMFVESMMPALLGHEDVVLDRCWVSEPIYADAFRQGKDRVGMARSRQLDRLAMRCGAVIVKCLPPWAHVKSSFTGRQADEYLDNEQQLLRVYGDYSHDLNTHLHEVEYDYTKSLGKPLGLVAMELERLVEYQRVKNPCHSLNVNSAGNLSAPILLVGDSFAERQDSDPLYQWPFGSLSNIGCSMWLSRQLDDADISEQSLLWVNADELTNEWVVPLFDREGGPPQIVTLGEDAERKVASLHLSRHSANHPQYWKRFCSGTPGGYPLLRILKDLMS